MARRLLFWLFPIHGGFILCFDSSGARSGVAAAFVGSVGLVSSNMSRLPFLSLSRDSDFWRQRIHKEQKAGDQSTAFDVTWPGCYRSPYTQPSGLTPQPVAPVAPFAALSRSDQLVSRSPFVRPQTVSTAERDRAMLDDQFRPRKELLPRSPSLSMALQKGWAEPPLVMAKGFSEPPRVFRKYLEASTHSVHQPAAPVLHWKH